MNGWDNGMGTGGWVMMVVLWIVLIGVIMWAITRLLPSRRTDAQNAQVHSVREPEAPQEILDRRLALGEIDTATYDALSRKLGTGAGTGGG